MSKTKKNKSTKEEFTYSRLMTFLECERKEFFQYLAGGAGVAPAEVQDFFVEGEFGHYALQHWYKTGRMLRDNMTKRVSKSIDALGEIPPELDNRLRIKLTAMIGACQAYKMHYKADLDRWEILACEEPFELDLGEGRVWRGKLDLVVKDKSDDTIGLIDHKFLQAISNITATLPLNPQQLTYVKGVEKLVGKMPDWYMWNIIKKSSLRQKTAGSLEPLVQFETRVQQQYLEEPDKMFYRTQPKMVEPLAVERAWDDMMVHLDNHHKLSETGEMPPMRFSACVGMFGNPCVFGPACLAKLLGRGAQGWDAPECRGLYRVKEVQHEELDLEIED
jgi:hypothetical protein